MAQDIAITFYGDGSRVKVWEWEEVEPGLDRILPKNPGVHKETVKRSSNNNEIQFRCFPLFSESPFGNFGI